MSKIIGIDLGTTNSVVAVMEDGHPKVIADPETKSPIVPSVVGINAAGELIVGQEALNQYSIAPDKTVRSIKRKMGSDEKVTMAGKEYSPPEISAMILRHLKQIAEKYLGEETKKAVITVPAYFSDAQRQATKDAGEIAGLEVVRIINEPTAAALAYGIDKQDNQHLLVYDLGGGTFDVSVIEKVGDVIEVRASHGNNHLGGDDFDELLQNYAVEELKKEHSKLDINNDIRAMARLNRLAEATKVKLSSKPFVQMHTEYLAKKGIFSSIHLDMEISRSQFIALIDELLQSTKESIAVALKDAELTAEDIDKILLVGGSTRIPAVWELIHQHMGKAPHADINPDQAVALGAAVQAGIISGEQIGTVLVDVAPYSLGVEHAIFKSGKLIPGFYKSLIKRNSTIPVSASDAFYTVHPEQDTVEIKVFQGDYTIAAMNNFVGGFQFKGLAEPEKKNMPREVVIQFDYDVDGIIHVTAIDRKSKRQEKGLTITESQIKLSTEDKEKAQQAISEMQSQDKQVSIGKLHEKAIAFQEKLEKDNRESEVISEVKKLIGELNQAKEGAKLDDRVLTRLSEIMYDYDFE